MIFLLLVIFGFNWINADIYDEVKNSRNFTGKVVLVTGSSSGIGEETVKLFSSLGAQVVVTGRNATNIKRVAEEAHQLSTLRLKPLEVVADLTINEDVLRLVNETIKQFGRLDVLVNNAGIGSQSSIRDSNIMENFDNIFNIDLRAPLYLIHLSMPYLEKSKGTIINIGSNIGFIPLRSMFTYCMAKAAVNMMTQVLAVELGSSGIRVNSISPGRISTNFDNNQGVSEQIQQISIESVIESTPLKRTGDTLDVAKSIAFLASSDAQFITGANIFIDGGALYNTTSG